MDKYLDLCVIENSTTFVVDHLLDRTDYNYFNNVTENQLFQQKWISEFDCLEGKCDLSEEQALALNRRKLMFILSNFHNIRCDNPNLRLDANYVFSRHFPEDLSDGFELISNRIVRFIGAKYNETDMIKGKDASYTFDTLVTSVTALYGLAGTFAVPIPGHRNFPNDKSKLFQNFTNTRAIFEDYYVIEPQFYIMNQSYFSQIIQSFEIKGSDLNKIKVIHLETDRTEAINESTVSSIIKEFLLNSVCKFLRGRFDKINLLNKRSEISQVIPDFGLEIKKLGQEYRIPVEIKSNGISTAFEQMKNNDNSAMNELSNQILYQMFTYKSNVGFLVDIDSLIVVQLQDYARTRVENLPGGDQYRLKINVQCFDRDSSPYSLAGILFLLSDYHFKYVNEDNKKEVETLFHSLKMTKESKEVVRYWRNDFLRTSWISKFTDYSIQKDWYINNTYPSLKISSGCYFEIMKLDFEVPSLEEKDFELLSVLQGNNGVDKDRYNSQVVKVKGINPQNKYYLKEMILKVYNPAVSPQPKGILPLNRYLDTFSYSLSMFLYEIRAYRVLRGQNPPGLMNSRPDTSENKGSDINYIPLLIQYGVCNWDIEEGILKGFYLLLEYIEDDSHTISAEKLHMEANKGIAEIHRKGVIHRDIHRHNFHYNASKNRVYFFDFGQSEFKTFNPKTMFPKEDNIRSDEESALEKEDLERLLIACSSDIKSLKRKASESKASPPPKLRK